MAIKKVILIVDETADNRRMFREIWQGEEEYEILEAAGREEALALLGEREDISLILIGPSMPRSGLKLLKELKGSEEFSYIPVLVSRQGYDAGIEEEALLLGAEDLIFAPHAGKTVKARVRNTLKKNLYDRAHTDELTGLSDFTAFCLRTEKLLAMDMESEYVILRLNILNFKLINELNGPKTGDGILISLARTLSRAVGNDGTCTRMKADHFACCMPHRKAKEGSVFAQIMKEGVARLEKQYSLLVHGGVYIVGDRSLPIAVMCDRAGLACQHINDNMVKQFSYYNEEEGEKYREEQLLLRDMKRALGDGQFYIVMQPIFDLKTQRLSSAEALVRWKHPKKGFISPGVFIPLLESSGLITRLDMFVCEEVCRALSEFKAEGIPVLPVSVNISRMDFDEAALVEEINGLVEKYGLEKDLLKIEVTESAYAQNKDEIIKQVRELQREGYGVLMDDFGSGYSSLNTLKELPVDILKIDMEFMNQLEDSKRAAGIVACIVTMAKMLGLKTIAEGVENERQVEFLKRTGCDRIQGYFYSQPMRPADYRKFVEEQIGKN